MRINHGGTTNAHGACTVRYGTSTIHGGSRRGQSWSSVAKPWMIRRTTVHECFKQFKTSVALLWSFPNHHDLSRFTTIHHGSTTNHHGTPRYTTILLIVTNRSGTVGENRECVNGALGISLLVVYVFRVKLQKRI